MPTTIESIIQSVTQEDIEVVSFDIFDTLLLRPMLNPTDLFRLVGKQFELGSEQFSSMRCAAEREARNCRPFGDDDVTLDAIYEQMEICFAVEHDVSERMKQTELQLEMQLLYPRASAKRIFDAAITAGKTVIITSDMYLPEHFIEQILKKNGYTGYTKLFLSCSYMESKGSGRLYKRIAAEFAAKGIHTSAIVHIGDNPRADVSVAKANGFRAILLPRTVGMFNANKWFCRTTVNRYDFDNTFLLGIVANILFDDPFMGYDKNSIINGDSANIGFIVAPMLLSFVKWMMDELSRHPVEKLLLVYRDGYLIEKIIRILQTQYTDIAPRKELFLNRAIRYAFAARHPHPIMYSDVPFSPDMTVEDFIKYRLLVSDEDEVRRVFEIFKFSGFSSPKDKIGNRHRIYRLASRLDPIFSTHAHETMKAVTQYCHERALPQERVAVFDVGYRGSVARFLQTELGYEHVTGYQLFATPAIRTVHNGVQLNTYVEYGFHVQRAARILHPLIEQIISSQEASPAGLGLQNGKIIFAYERSDTDGSDSVAYEAVEKLQGNVLTFCEVFCARFGDLIHLMEFDPYNEFQLLVELCNRPAKKDASAIRKMSFQDAKFITGGAGDNPYYAWYAERFPSHRQSPEAISTRIDGIKNLLRKLHLFNITKKVYRTFVPYRPVAKSETITSKEFVLENDREIVQILKDYSEACDYSTKRKILLFGAIASFDKGSCAFLNQLAQRNDEFSWTLFSEARLPQERISEKVCIPIIVMPKLFMKGCFDERLSISITAEQNQIIESKTYLQEAVLNLQGYYPQMGDGYPEYLVVRAYEFFNSLFGVTSPKLVILWNQFYALHGIIANVAKEHTIPVKYLEFGNLPGTFVIDSNGQMGESYPAVCYREFYSLPVSGTDIEEAGVVWSYLQKSRLNRNVQADNSELEEVRKKLTPQKPIIFYAGQLDYEAGICPYTEKAARCHAPVFSSSDEAALFLGELAKKNGWELIYKPHPAVKNRQRYMPANIHVIRDCDINDLIDLSNVVVTILSQTGYIAAIRKKPVVMLGYTQLRGKGCTYEAFSKMQIEKAICEALRYGMTHQMCVEFQRHIAQMNKYYLFDDGGKRDVRYGRDVRNYGIDEL